MAACSPSTFTLGKTYRRVLLCWHCFSSLVEELCGGVIRPFKHAASWLAFTCMQLSSQLILEHFHRPRRRALPLSSHFPFAPTSLSPGWWLIYLMTLDQPCLHISCNHTICGLLWLASAPLHNISSFYTVAWLSSSGLCWVDIPCFPRSSVMDIWVSAFCWYGLCCWDDLCTSFSVIHVFGSHG